MGPSTLCDTSTLPQEVLLKREMSAMAERMGRAQGEAHQLRAEREELHAQLRDIEASLTAGGRGERAWGAHTTHSHSSAGGHFIGRSRCVWDHRLVASIWHALPKAASTIRALYRCTAPPPPARPARHALPQGRLHHQSTVPLYCPPAPCQACPARSPPRPLPPSERCRTSWARHRQT